MIMQDNLHIFLNLIGGGINIILFSAKICVFHFSAQL